MDEKVASNLIALEAQTQTKVTSLKTLPIIVEMLEKLERYLPEYICYHNKDHAEDVLHEVVLFAETDRSFSGRQIELLAIGAVYHNAGYIVRPEDNGVIACSLVGKAMERHGHYSETEKKQVVAMIEAVQMKGIDLGLMQPDTTDTLSAFLQDADLSNFGRADFLEKAGLVLAEQKVLLPHMQIHPQNYLAHLLKMMRAHTWKTTAARTLRQEQKEKNIQELERRLQMSDYL